MNSIKLRMRAALQTTRLGLDLEANETNNVETVAILNPAVDSVRTIVL